jgi:hypothetical protein
LEEEMEELYVEGLAVASVLIPPSVRGFRGM